jgi:hypothetical protein
MLLIGSGGPQAGFSAPRCVSRGFRKKQIGPADSPPPRWSPGPGYGPLGAERGRAAKQHAQLALPVAPAPAPGDPT